MNEDDGKAPERGDEILARYAAGERDLRGADLYRAHLAHAHLADARLSGANLRGANLTGAKLDRADLSGADLSGANLTGAKLNRVDFSGADLRNAYLGGAKLNRASLHRADLTGADLTGAHLSHAHLSGADLSGANFTGANLTGADLTGAHFNGANLSGANLIFAHIIGANLRGAYLGGAKLDGAMVGWTVLDDLDLTPLCEADPPIDHRGPSTVGDSAILRSLASPNLKAFLIRAGVLEVFAEYRISCGRSLDPLGVFRMLQSTFISYGSPDEVFARRLYEALHRNGVTTFFFPEHAVPGARLHRTMRKGVNDFDRVLLVCSKASLDRSGVLNEIEETLAREARNGGASYLIPIAIDDYVFSAWKPERDDIAQAVRDKIVGPLCQ